MGRPDPLSGLWFSSSQKRDFWLGKSLPRKYLLLGHVSFFAAPWTVAHQAPLSIGFPRQEYRSGLPFPPPGDFPHPETELGSLASAGGFFTTLPPGKPSYYT